MNASGYKLLLCSITSIFCILITYNLTLITKESDYTENILPIFISLSFFIVSIYVCSTVFPDFYVDVFEGGARLSVDEAGIEDNRVSLHRMDWKNFCDIKVLGGPLIGLSTVRLRLRKNSKIEYRKSRIILTLLNYVFFYRKEFVYINIKYMERDEKEIFDLINYHFQSKS